jgi:putative transposase
MGWVVERTFGWFGRYRRLSKDYEYLPTTSETMLYIAMINLMLRRLSWSSSPQVSSTLGRKLGYHLVTLNEWRKRPCPD